VYVLLAAIGFIGNWLSRSAGSQQPLPSFLITAFLTWRVSRGGWFARRILIVASFASGAVAAVDIARRWDLTVMALVIIGAVQVALLVSPPVYGRTRRTPIPVRAPGWARLVRRPPAWLLPWGLLAGVLVTLACLGSMDWVAVPGCRPAASDACSALAEGYPLRWLTAVPTNEPLISKGALFKDCAQWALISTSVLYMAWLWLTVPNEI
jgi:hypothetical protein